MSAPLPTSELAVRVAGHSFAPARGSVSGRTHLDLFSGIGGFALAAQRTGWQTIGFSEIEPYACKILKRHWPDVPNYGDIRNIRGVRADLITGGFPCQPYSLSGKRAGASDDRALWPEMCRVIDEAKPSWVLGENVAGLVTMELDRVLSDLEAIGYSAWPIVVPACAVDARHRRDRVWIVAHSEGNSSGRGLCETGTEQDWNQSANGGEDMADANGSESRQPSEWEGRENLGGGSANRGGNPATRGEDVSDDGRGSGERTGTSIGGCPQTAWWQPEPELGRVADGIPNRAHRLRGLGNAIVPQVAEMILAAMARTQNEKLSV